MKMLKLYVLLLPAAVSILYGTTASACNVCHSKNPKMVRMHEALGFKDCFTCHRFEGEKTPAQQKTRMKNDPRCVPCHRAATSRNQ